MPADVHQAAYTLPKFSKHSYAVLMKTITNSLVFDSSDAAAFRLHVLEVYKKHGWRAATSAFKIGKSTLYEWRKKYYDSQKRLFSLIPTSTRPHTLRSMRTDYRIVEFIISFRREYGNIGKGKLKSFLDEYTNTIGISPIGLTTIGKIIKRKNLFFKKKKKFTHKKYGLISRTKTAPKERMPGYLEIDSIILWVLNKRWYFVSLIDVVTKIATVEAVPSLSSRYTKRVLEAFIRSYPYTIRVIQTDNGSEFLGEFHLFLEEKHILHQFIYPRSPRINGVVERFNRTIQEEFIQRSEEIFYSEVIFRRKLKDYIFWYNTKRPHYALKLQTPDAYLKTFIKFSGM